MSTSLARRIAALSGLVLLAGCGLSSPASINRAAASATPTTATPSTASASDMPRPSTASAQSSNATPATTAANGSGSTGTSPSTNARSLCQGAHLSITLGPRVSPQTGEQAVLVAVTNAGPGACWVRGYLTVHFTLAGAPPHPLPPGGAQYVTSASPAWVKIQPRQDAYVKIATYRCDLGNATAVTSLTASLPGSSAARTLTLASAGAGSLPYCPGQPGHTGRDFEMSPIEATIAATAHR